MRTPQLATHFIRVVAVPLLLAGAAAGAAPAMAAAQSGPPGAAASFTVSGTLQGVSATSASNAWAVGTTAPSGSKTLIARWNGTTWTRVPSPSPGSAGLEGVAAGSTGSAWAVGSTGNGLGSVQTLNLRWNGTAWKQATSPNPLGSPLSGRADADGAGRPGHERTAPGLAVSAGNGDGGGAGLRRPPAGQGGDHSHNGQPDSGPQPGSVP